MVATVYNINTDRERKKIDEEKERKKNNEETKKNVGTKRLFLILLICLSFIFAGLFIVLKIKNNDKEISNQNDINLNNKKNTKSIN